MRLVELSRSEHRELRIRADRVEACAARQHLIPIVVSELRKAATQYPIVFAKHPETARFAPYVLSGLGVEENLFWSGTELDVAYVPLNVHGDSPSTWAWTMRRMLPPTSCVSISTIPAWIAAARGRS
jgi:hypothetical protein